jgi:hypothetical protein
MRARTEESGFGISSGLHVGSMFGENTAAIVEMSMILAPEGDTAIGSRIIALNIRHWIGDRIWIGGGLGEIEGEINALSIAISAGYELTRTRVFALDLAGRLTTAGRGSQRINIVTLNFGFNWY